MELLLLDRKRLSGHFVTLPRLQWMPSVENCRATFAHNGYHVGGGRDTLRIEPDYGTPLWNGSPEAMAETELKSTVPMEQFLNDEVRLNEEAQQSPHLSADYIICNCR